MDYRNRMMNGQRVSDYYAERSSRTLDEINARQRRNHIRANGGMTGGDAIAALVVIGFRKMPRPVRRLLLTAVLLFVSWCIFGEAIVGAIHNARQ